MQVMNQAGARLKELGMYTFVRWNYIFIAPPLTITENQVRLAFVPFDSYRPVFRPD